MEQKIEINALKGVGILYRGDLYDLALRLLGVPRPRVAFPASRPLR